ncbi:hypothetical protein BDV38DRAFT_240092 [Aspergillus pseudotamarii]|uniref:Uncharacterized protein n=1 Tax=Aspergillus pseudotamarii TaxID=132259 RepID=A0A5N6T2X4_ASPPS|nr:uncharacterized protein BDV38DRAFT_240092 [Aspergillus pseudotamarii]KAE8140653.1 hypothetical protein BDV38DRAFT_240092 [Aspergillus pseudotamarii]
MAGTACISYATHSTGTRTSTWSMKCRRESPVSKKLTARVNIALYSVIIFWLVCEE